MSGYRFHAPLAVLALTLVLLCAARTPAFAGDTTPLTTILVFDRPPYYVLQHGQPAGGFLLDKALLAFKRAGLPYVVQEMPPGRILARLSHSPDPQCSIGWFRTPDRETFRFSQPLYYDRPLGVLVRQGMPQPQPGASLATLLGAGWTWGLREGFSYGQAFDRALADYPATRKRRFADPLRMLRLLAEQRLDAVLIEPEEMEWLLGKEPELAASLRLIRLADAPPAAARYIMCSADFPAPLMRRLNTALAALGSGSTHTARVAVDFWH